MGIQENMTCLWVHESSLTYTHHYSLRQGQGDGFSVTYCARCLSRDGADAVCMSFDLQDDLHQIRFAYSHYGGS